MTVSEDRIRDLAPRPYDYDARKFEENWSKNLDLNWNIPDKIKKDFREFSIELGYNNDDDGVLWWLACRRCFGENCDHLIFAEGIIEAEEDLMVPFKWLETQDDSLLEWKDAVGGTVQCDEDRSKWM